MWQGNRWNRGKRRHGKPNDRTRPACSRGKAIGAPIECLESRLLLTAGGWTGAGVSGAYYANSTLSGSPAFTRLDDRIDSDWAGLSPAGSTNPSYAAVGVTNWSAQWNGTVIAGYSETYTFSLTTSGGARLYIQPVGNGNQTTLVNDWTAHNTTVDTATYTMVAGQEYAVELQYFDDTRDAVTRLHWSSLSTPDAAIEPATQIGVNGGTAVDWDPSVIFADAFKESRIDSATNPSANNAPVTLDSNGWPTTDFEVYVMAGLNVNTSGLYTMTFTGSAASITVDDESISVVSNTYVSSTNTTTFIFKDLSTYPTGTFGNQRVTMTGTKRTSTSASDTGVTNISIMRPITPGNMTASYPAGTLYTSAYEAMISQFTAVRFMDYLATNSGQGDVGGNQIVNWTDRLLPSDSSQQGIAASSTIGYQGQGGAIEYAVELCNETGKDMWFNVPLQASDAYITDLAEGLKYGFAGNGTPYTQPTANPTYPPLNPNLKCYLELSNEVWNGGFYQNSQVQSFAVAAVNGNTATGQILNYDGIGTSQSTVLGERWWILRTTQMSTDFRAVWGNASMMTTIRPVFEFQYANDNNTASNTLGFIDDYFDNADGVAHVATPEPVNYYLFAAGGGWYNSVNTDTGLGAVTIPNNTFTTPALASATAQADPTGASWTFTGTAGQVSNNPNLAAAATSTTLAGAILTPTANGDSAVGAGYSFTVGSSDVYVNQLGRWIISGNKESHTLFLCNTSGKVLAQGSLTTTGQTAGQYAYVSVGTVHLLAGQTYYVFSTEPSYSWQGFDSYYGPTCTETTFAGITIKNALTVTMPQGEWYTSLWTFTTGTAGDVGGPVDFRYVTAAGSGPVAYPPAAETGNQAGYIQGNGTISQVLTFPAGVCDVTFYAAEGAMSGNESFSVYIDGTLLASETPGYTYYSFYRTNGDVDLTAGNHTLTFIGSGNGSAFLDTVQVETVAAMINSGDQSIAAQTVSEVDWASAYGLKTTGYEGGFEIGGDSTTGASVVSYAANMDPSVQQSTIATVDEYLSAGGFLPMVFTAVGEWWSLAMSPTYGSPNIYDLNTPKLAGYASAMAALPPADSNATLVPGVLTTANVSLLYANSYGGSYEDNGGDIEKDTGFLSWNMMMPISGNYAFTVTTSGNGSAALIMDGNVVGNITTTGNYTTTVNLVRGANTLLVQSTGSAVITVSQIVITEVGAPAAPTLTSAAFGDTVAYLTWQSVGNAASYMIGYENQPGPYTNFVTLGNVTSDTLTGLVDTQIYNVAVYAVASGGQTSLPSTAVRLAHRSTAAQALITFEGLPISASGTYETEPLVVSGYSFTSFGNSQGQSLQIWGTTGPSSFKPTSNVLFSAYWGSSQQIVRQDGTSFDLYSLDLWANIYDTNDSAVITGHDSTGAQFQQIVNFGNSSTNNKITTTLNWVDIDKVTVTWWSAANGGGSSRFGGVDNLLVDDAIAPAVYTTSPLPGATRNQAYSTQLYADGGAMPYTWSLASGSLPGGLTLGSTGNLSGTPTVAGTFNFTVSVVGGNGGASTQALAITVAPASLATPVFGNLTAPAAISYGTATAAFAGSIAAGTSIPSGNETVAITLNGVTQNAAINAQGNFTTSFTASTLPASVTPYQVTYAYAGDANFNSVTNMTTTTLTVNKAATTTVVTSSSASPSYGQAVTFTATITPASGGNETGTVQFQIDGGNVGSPVTLNGNTAAYATSTLSIGSHTIVAIYSGDGNFTASTSPAFTQAIAPTAWLSATSAATWNAGNLTLIVTGNATITGDPNKFGVEPLIYDSGNTGNLTIDTQVAAGGDGDATVHLGLVSGNGTTIITGTNVLVAGNFAQAALLNNGTVTLAGAGTIGQLTGSGSLTIGNGTSNNLVQLAAVAIPDSFNNTQQAVTISIGSSLDITDNALLLDYGPGSTPLAAVRTAVANGSIFSSTANAGNPGQYTVGYADATEVGGIPAGNVKLMYTLSGDALLAGTVSFGDYSVLQNNYNQTGRDCAQGDFNHDGTVNFGDYSLLQNNYNQTLKATPTLAWPVPAAITYGTALSATQLDATASVPGTFAYTPAAGTVLAAGTPTLAVTFTPTDTTDYYTVTGSVNLTVSKAATTVAITSSQAVPVLAAPITFTATITPASGTGPTGTVQFQIDGNNAGTPVAVSGNTATCTIATLSIGNHSIAAIYHGDGNFTGSISPMLTQTVGYATVTYTLSINDDGTGHYCAGHYAVYAADTLNNAGLASYDIHLAGAATITNYSPQGNYDDGTGCGTSDEIGFTTLRTANNLSPATGSQNTVGYANGGKVILVYGIGQTAGNLANDQAPGSTGAVGAATQVVYAAPVELLKGTFTAAAPTFTSTSLDTGNVLVTHSGYGTAAPVLAFSTTTVVSGSVSQPTLVMNVVLATTPVVRSVKAPIDQLYSLVTAEHLFAADLTPYDTEAASYGWSQEEVIGYVL